MTNPRVIQGGMGVAVSSWRLANAVSSLGQLGVVSGTGIDTVLSRRLQLGDPGGHMRRAIAAFPVPSIADRVLHRYYIPGGKAHGVKFKSKPVPAIKMPPALTELIVVANFVEVFLAKEGHSNPVGINLMEKIQLTTLASLFGAMLAGVDVVLMGAGIPRAIPAVLDRLAEGLPAELRINVHGELPNEEHFARFDPRAFMPPDGLALARPRFFAIVASAALATTLARKSTGRVDGFVIEGPTAGGHNAPPRGNLTLDESGEPIYGDRDRVDLDQIRELGLPFWLAGSYGSPEGLSAALKVGAQGVQIGTAFAFCEESGIDASLKRRVLELCRSGEAEVFTDPFASPTGFPFKVARVEGTISERDVYESRDRVCDLGYLRQLYRKPDGGIGYRCPGEPLEDFLAKGGDPADAYGRKCICNALMATVGLGQLRADGYEEHALVTAGNDLLQVVSFFRGRDSYTAGDVLDYMLQPTSA